MYISPIYIYIYIYNLLYITYKVIINTQCYVLVKFSLQQA